MPADSDAKSTIRRAGVLAVVLGVHLGVIVAFVHELDTGAALRIPRPVLASIVEQDRRPPPPPPPPPAVRLRAPSRNPVPLDVPLPLIQLPSPPPPVLTGGPPEPHPAVYVPLALLSKPDIDAYYPAEATRRGLSGATLTEVCVAPDAQLASSRIVHSSGHPELDAAALQMIQHMRWKAATRDDTPVTDCRPMVVSFLLRGKKKR